MVINMDLFNSFKEKFEKNNYYLYLSLIILYSFFSQLYLYFQYDGLRADHDLGIITKTSQAVQSQNTIYNSFQYNNGFGYQTTTTFLSDILGLSVQKILILPLGFLYVIFAYLFFNEFFKNKKIALISTFILSLQPDLLFLMSRGSHEKFSFILFLLAFLLVIHIAKNNWGKKNFIYLALLYLVIFSLNIYNIWFSGIFLLLIFVYCFFGIIFSLIFNESSIFFKKTIYFLTPSILIYLSMFIIYPRIFNVLNISRSISYKLFSFFPLFILLVLLFLLFSIFFCNKNKMTKENNISNLISKFFNNEFLTNFSVIMSISVYLILLYFITKSSNLSFSPINWFFLTLINWIIIPASFFTVYLEIKKYFTKKIKISKIKIFFIFIYLSFLVIFFMSIIISKYVNNENLGSNLELRIFPYFFIFAVPFASELVVKTYDKLLINKKRKIFSTILIIALISIFIFNSHMKAANNPLFSNNCIFYSQYEKNTLDYIENNADNLTIWAGYNERILNSYYYNSEFENFNKVNFSNNNNPESLIYSQIIESYSLLNKENLTRLNYYALVFNNGKSSFYISSILNNYLFDE